NRLLTCREPQTGLVFESMFFTLCTNIDRSIWSCHFLLRTLVPTRTTLFPYTTLFRSMDSKAMDWNGTILNGPESNGTECNARQRSEEHTSELQSDQISYAVFCLKKKNQVTGKVIQVTSYYIAVDKDCDRRETGPSPDT